MSSQQIEKLFFLIHPLRYEPHAQDSEFSSEYRLYLK